MVYRVPVGDGTFCYTPNCRLHSAAWQQAMPVADERAALMRDFGLHDSRVNRETTRESGADVIQAIPQEERVNINPTQLDGVLDIMRQFGTQDDDSWGFRAYIAKKASFYEWSERGADIRYVQRVRSDGTIYAVDLYRISGTTTDEVKVLRGQAAIRHTLGLEEYAEAERQQIAENYWTAAILPTLGNIPGGGARFLRKQYLDEINRQPELIPKILDAWAQTPQAKILHTLGSGRTFIDVVAPVDDPHNGHVRTKLLAAIDGGDKRTFNKVFNQYGKHLPQRTQGSVAAWAKKFTAAEFAQAAQNT